MNPSIRNKLERVSDRFGEITALLAEPETQEHQHRFRDLSREYAQLESVVSCYRRYQKIEEEIASAREMLADPEMADLAREEIVNAESRREVLEPELKRLLMPPDPNDQRNVFLEIRAGTGGAEAALFAGDLLRMYLRFAEVTRLAGRADERERRRARRLQGGRSADQRRRRLLAAQVRVRHPPRPAGAGDRVPGAHPHLGLYGGRPAGGRGHRRRGHQLATTCASTPTAPPAPAAST